MSVPIQLVLAAVVVSPNRVVPGASEKLAPEKFHPVILDPAKWPDPERWNAAPAKVAFLPEALLKLFAPAVMVVPLKSALVREVPRKAPVAVPPSRTRPEKFELLALTLRMKEGAAQANPLRGSLKPVVKSRPRRLETTSSLSLPNWASERTPSGSI